MCSERRTEQFLAVTAELPSSQKMLYCFKIDWPLEYIAVRVHGERAHLLMPHGYPTAAEAIRVRIFTSVV
jgi:hypothetical protein